MNSKEQKTDAEQILDFVFKQAAIETACNYSVYKNNTDQGHGCVRINVMTKKLFCQFCEALNVEINPLSISNTGGVINITIKDSSNPIENIMYAKYMAEAFNREEISEKGLIAHFSIVQNQEEVDHFEDDEDEEEDEDDDDHWKDKADQNNMNW